MRRYLLVCVATLAAGCLDSFDKSNIKCTSGDHCPSDYTCVKAPGAVDGVCKKGTLVVDGGGVDVVVADGVRGADGRDSTSEEDTLPGRDGVVDYPAVWPDASAVTDAGASTTEPAAVGPDASVLGSEVGDSVSDVPADFGVTAPDVAGDLAVNAPDSTETKVDLPVEYPLTPDAVEVGPDLPTTGKTQGSSCMLASECASGFCVDGYCCDGTCTGTCQACDVANSLGKCTAIASGATPHPGHGACAATDEKCAGSCNGTSSTCSYPVGTCGTASCTGATYQPAGTCSAGSCVTPPTQGCPTNETCSGGACTCQSPNLTCSGACVDAQNDPKNCGACGHDCLGGTCSGALCQPKLLADVALSWEGSSTFMLSGSNIILNLGGRGMPTDAYNVWAVDINGAGAKGLRGIVANASRAVALDDKLYWITTSGSMAKLIACPQTSCSEASYSVVASRDGGSGSSIGAPLLLADSDNHELVWQEYVYANNVYTISVVRSGPGGPARALTSFSTGSLESWQAPADRPDRFFWLRYDSSNSTKTLYYLPTNAASASPTALTGEMTVSTNNIMANDTSAYLNTGVLAPYSVLAIPLPNGVIDTPASVYSGDASWNITDGQSAYGTYSGTSHDGIWRCSLTSCVPTYLARGFLESPGGMVVDGSAIYLLDRASSGSHFKVWKLAK